MTNYDMSASGSASGSANPERVRQPTAKSRTKNRTIYFTPPVDVWTKAQRIAQIEGTTLSDLISEFILKYVTERSSLIETVNVARSEAVQAADRGKAKK